MKTGVYLFLVLTMFSRLFNIDTVGLLKDIQKEEVAIEEVQELDQNTLTISLVGDIFMDGSLRGLIDRNGIDYPWEMVKDYFQNDDITIGNLETSITTRGEKWEDKQFNFRSDPKNLEVMKEASLDVVSLANNHSLDYGYVGFLDTLDHLDKYEIKRVGGGRNREEALKGLILEKNGVKIGVLGFSRVVPHVDWYATNKRPGIVGAYDVHIDQVIDRVVEMKENVDILVLSIHWGVEGSHIPRQNEIDLARKLIDNGVDIIMGHHPHVLQGIEIYKGRPIFYSLGNFIFSSRSENTRETMIAQVILKDKTIDKVCIIPCTIDNGRPIPASEENIEAKLKFINSISKDFNTKIDENGIIEIVQ
ncbi:MAG: CapA family protein [Tissierellia bacterium]|nr:CapA family protein [Tissierellia bacterium]